MAPQSAPISNALKAPMFRPKTGGPSSSNLSRLSSHTVCALRDQHQSYPERNVSLHRSGCLTHKIIPRRKSHAPQTVVSHRQIDRLGHCPQPEVYAWFHSMKQSPLQLFVTDVPSGDELCNIPGPRKHAVWGTWILACMCPNCNRSKLAHLAACASASL